MYYISDTWQYDYMSQQRGLISNYSHYFTLQTTFQHIMNTLNCIEYCILSFNEVLQFVYKNQEQNSFSIAISSSVSDDPKALYKCFFIVVVIIIIRLHCHAKRKTQPTASDIVWSVCVSVGYKCEPCNNSRTDHDAVWVVDSSGPKEPQIRKGPIPLGKGQFWGDMFCPIAKYRERIQSAIERRLTRSSCRLGCVLGLAHVVGAWSLPGEGAILEVVPPMKMCCKRDNNNNDRLTAFDPGQPG